MSNRPLLAIGLGLIAASLIGGSISFALASPSGDQVPGVIGMGGWMPHASSQGMYGWMDHDRMMRGLGFGDDLSGLPIPGATEVTARAAGFRFDPSRITVRVGDPVNLTLVNDDQIAHDLVVPALGVAVDAGAGESVTIGFTPDRAGTFEFWCSVPGHAAAGMTGTIEVTS